MRQTHTELEIIVCDDASTDGTFENMLAAAGNDERIKCVQNEHRLGLFENYNKCVSLANGVYIKPFAQDDELDPSAVSEMVSVFQREPGVKLVCVGRETDKLHAADEKDESETLLAPGRSKGKAVILECLSSYRNLIGEPVAVMCDQTLKQIPFDTEFHSLGDLDCWMRVLETGDAFYIDKRLVRFRQHSGTATTSMMENMDWLLDFYLLSKKYEKYLRELKVTRDQYCMRFTDLAGTLIDKLITSGKLNIDDLDGYREVAYFAMRRCAELSYKSREYDAVVGSTSWRITSPFAHGHALIQSRMIDVLPGKL